MRRQGESSLVERTAVKAFVHLKSYAAPAVGYCSQAVERNRCFRIGQEIQHEGVERWRVGCRDRSNAEGLIEDLKEMGDLRYHKISEVSSEELIA
jgi:hypothetical protein